MGGGKVEEEIERSSCARHIQALKDRHARTHASHGTSLSQFILQRDATNRAAGDFAGPRPSVRTTLHSTPPHSFSSRACCSYLTQAGASSNKKMSDFFTSLQTDVLAFQRLHRALSDSVSVHTQFLDKAANLFQQCLDFKVARRMQGDDLVQRIARMHVAPPPSAHPPPPSPTCSACAVPAAAVTPRMGAVLRQHRAPVRSRARSAASAVAKAPLRSTAGAA